MGDFEEPHENVVRTLLLMTICLCISRLMNILQGTKVGNSPSRDQATEMCCMVGKICAAHSGGGGGGGLVYGNWPSTAPKAGHVTDLRLILCVPPPHTAVLAWVKDTFPRRPSGGLRPMKLGSWAP